MSSGVITINDSDEVTQLSIQANSSSSVSVLGNFTFKGMTSNAVTLSNGEGITLTAPSLNSTLDGLTITWLSGTVDIVIAF
jgi:hypothetical protein